MCWTGGGRECERFVSVMEQRKLYIDITSFYNTDFMSGIQRVVREVTLRLLKMPDFSVSLFTWKREETELTVLNNEDYLACYDKGSLSKENIRKSSMLAIDDFHPGDILFELDSVWDGRCHNRAEVLPLFADRGVIISTYIYDVLPITNPEFWPEPIPLFYDYIAANLRYASSLITSVNETVKRLSKIAEKSNVPLPPCSVSWLGSDFKTESKSDGVSKKAEEIAQKGKYILCVGTIEPRKNHKVVLDAYDEKLSELGLNLVFAGRRDRGVDDLLARIDGHSKKNSGFFFLEGESDATIDFLYKNAYVVVFSTFDEGFGLPLVEALLHGAVCAVSDIPVMREVGGKACDYFNQNSSESLSELISSYLETPSLYDDCKSRASEYKPILWGQVVEKLKNELLKIEKDGQRENMMKDIDVNGIIQEIRDDIAARGFVVSGTQFSLFKKAFNQEKLNSALSTAQSTARVDMYAHISGSRCKTFIKKLIRKLVRPVLISQAHRQTSFNNGTVEALSQLARYTSELEKRISDLEKMAGEK